MQAKDQASSFAGHDLTPRILVGERFKAQCKSEHLISLPELQELLARAGGNGGPGILLLAGQGLGEEDLDRVADLAGSNALARPLVCDPAIRVRRASGAVTHKRLASNILISSPSCGDDCYEAQVMVDELCDDIRDHLTGQHIPGMLLMEAARQMVLATSETYLVGEEDAGKLAYITHRQSIEFYEFVFPLNVKIVARFDALRRAGRLNFQAGMTIDFLQSETLCARANFKFSALNREIIQAQEQRLAALAIAQGIAGVGEGADTADRRIMMS